MIPLTGPFCEFKYHAHFFFTPGESWGLFLYLDVMPMFCPYPTTCEWDAYRKTGVHFCNIGKCQYSLTAKAMLEREIALLSCIRHRTERQQQTLEKLVEQYGEEFGNGI